MAIATAMLSLALGIRIPANTAIIGGMTSNGRLVPNPMWEKHDFDLLEKGGVERLVIPLSAHGKIQQMIGGSGGGGGSKLELVPVDSVEDIVDRILKPLYVPTPASSSPPTTDSGSIQHEGAVVGGPHDGDGHDGSSDEFDPQEFLDLL